MTADESVDVAGFPIRRTTLGDAVNEILEQSAQVPSTGRPYRLVNSYTLALASREAAYAAVLRRSSDNLPDGKPLSAIVRRRSSSPVSQVRGPALFEKCLDEGRYLGISHYFLGGSPELLDELVARAHRSFPGIKVAGSFAPPFRSQTASEIEQQDDLIRQARPDLLWVGLGTPKQDYEAERLATQLRIPVVGVGAAFDFFTGLKPEAPAWVTTAGLEWLFRLASEPRRLWRRYLFGNARFVWIIAQDVLPTRR